MTGNYTLMMVKPDAVRNGNAEAIFQEIKKHGFEIVAQKKLQLSRYVSPFLKLTMICSINCKLR